MVIIRCVVVAIVALATALPASAVDYFVSSQLGNDQFDGRSALASNGTGPFASLKPLSSLNLRHGDRVLLHCGERFTGPLHLILSSRDAGELTLGNFGECTDANHPVIDGRLPLDVAANGQLQQFVETGRIEQVFAGDKVLPRARYPEQGYLIVPAGAAVSAESLSPYGSLLDRQLHGARLHARTQEWFIEERDVVDGGRMGSRLTYPLRPKAGAYLTGKAWMIGTQRAWSFDPGERRLSIRAAPDEVLSKVPAGNLLQVTGRGSLSVVGVDFDAAGGDAINCHLDGTVTIQQVSIRRATGNGISISGAGAAYIAVSSIADVGLDGIFFAETKRVFVRRNQIANAGLYGGPRPSLAAINAHRTTSATIEENIVENSAYHGIRFAGDARIRRNFVSRSCLFLSDCGAIYTWRRNADDRRPHSEVVGNTIIGASGDTTVKLGVNDWFAGIYLDEFSSDILVAENVIVAVNQGIYLHNASDSIVRNNVVRALRKSIIDAADLTKFPNGNFVANSVGNNSVRLGSFTARVVDNAGKLKTFSFGDSLRVELRSGAGASKGRIGGKCVEDKIFSLDNREMQNSALLAVFNCE